MKDKGDFVFVLSMTYARGHITRFTFEKDEEIMKILDEAVLQLKARKRIITQESMEWLGNKLPRTVTSRLLQKSRKRVTDCARPFQNKYCAALISCWVLPFISLKGGGGYSKGLLRKAASRSG